MPAGVGEGVAAEGDGEAEAVAGADLEAGAESGEVGGGGGAAFGEGGAGEPVGVGGWVSEGPCEAEAAVGGGGFAGEAVGAPCEGLEALTVVEVPASLEALEEGFGAEEPAAVVGDVAGLDVRGGDGQVGGLVEEPACGEAEACAREACGWAGGEGLVEEGLFGGAERVVVEEFVGAHLAPAEEETILEEVLFEEEFWDFEAVVVEAVDGAPEEALAGGDGGGRIGGEGVAVADADGEGEGPA